MQQFLAEAAHDFHADFAGHHTGIEHIPQLTSDLEVHRLWGEFHESHIGTGWRIIFG